MRDNTEALSELSIGTLTLNVTSPAQIPMVLLIEILVLNGIVGLIAGAPSMKSGLIAAIGVHFWVDIVWHAVS